MAKLIDSETLKRVLTYDPLTGEFRRHPKKHSRSVNSPGRIDKDGYRLIWVEGREYRAHRLAWLYVHGGWPPGLIDHINGSRSDNRIANLRAATQQQNQANKLKTGGSSQYKGVHFRKDVGKWSAMIRVDQKTRALGLFRTEEEAHGAYCAAAKDAFGEFANDGAASGSTTDA